MEYSDRSGNIGVPAIVKDLGLERIFSPCCGMRVDVTTFTYLDNLVCYNCKECGNIIKEEDVVNYYQYENLKRLKIIDKVLL